MTAKLNLHQSCGFRFSGSLVDFWLEKKRLQAIRPGSMLHADFFPNDALLSFCLRLLWKMGQSRSLVWRLLRVFLWWGDFFLKRPPKKLFDHLTGTSTCDMWTACGHLSPLVRAVFLTNNENANNSFKFEYPHHDALSKSCSFRPEARSHLSTWSTSRWHVIPDSSAMSWHLPINMASYLLTVRRWGLIGWLRDELHFMGHWLGRWGTKPTPHRDAEIQSEQSTLNSGGTRMTGLSG